MALKAKRNYQEIVKGVQRAKVAPPPRRKKASEDLKQSCEYLAQEKEFGTFLAEELAKDRPFQFLKDMAEKHKAGELLSDNMKNAIRKCMQRAEDRKKDASEDKELPTITLKIRQFLMLEMGIDSRVITGKVKAESAKAWLIDGHADMSINLSWCVRCGRELKEPASQLTGMGAVCAEKMGIPYDPKDVLSMPKKERDKIRKQFIKKLKNQKFERWIPKSQVEVLS